MAGLSGLEIYAIVFVVVLSIVVAGLLLYLLRRIKLRRAKLLNDLSAKAELSQDRAFNRIAMARREASVLSANGVDVRRAQELVAEAQGAFDTRQYDTAYRHAQSAHEALVNARQHGARSTGAPVDGSSAAASHRASGPTTTSPLPSSEPTPPRTTIPKYRAEAQFQIRILGEELDGLPARRARDASATEATGLRRQASKSFDSGDYSEAFRLALRGRRTLGSTLESLPATGGGANRPTASVDNGNGSSPDIAQTAESVAGAERCPDCGYPTMPGDGFCRGCGRPRTATACPMCGAPRAADEPFCGKCGTRFSSG